MRVAAFDPVLSARRQRDPGAVARAMPPLSPPTIPRCIAGPTASSA